MSGGRGGAGREDVEEEWIEREREKGKRKEEEEETKTSRREREEGVVDG